jgi:enoyl-CoA hydratase/carnithine racemase
VIKYEKQGHVAVFTLNRPKAMNAVSFELATLFEKLMDTFEADEDAWVGIVCSSHPKVFCAGASQSIWVMVEANITSLHCKSTLVEHTYVIECLGGL